MQEPLISIKQVANSEEFEQCLRIRYKVFVEEKKKNGLKSHHYDEDRYDAQSIHFLAYIDDVPVATNRIIPYSEQSGMPVTTMWNIDTYKRYKIAEVSKLCILPDHRGKKLLTYFTLLNFKYGLKHGYEFYFINANVTMTSFLKRVGLVMFDTPKIYRPVEEMGVPFFLKLDEIKPSIRRRIDALDERFQLLSHPTHKSLNIGQ